MKLTENFLIFNNNTQLELFNKAFYYYYNEQYVDEILRFFQKKYKVIKAFNEATNLNFASFSEVFLNRDFNVLLNSSFNYELVSACNSKAKKSVFNRKAKFALMENNKFATYLNSKNRFFPLSFDFLFTLKSLPSNILVNEDKYLSDILFLKYSLSKELKEQNYAYSKIPQEILVPELQPYSFLIVEGASEIDEELDLKLCQYLDEGGNLVLLGDLRFFNNISNLKKLLTAPQLKFGKGMLQFDADLYQVNKAQALVITSCEPMANIKILESVAKIFNLDIESYKNAIDTNDSLKLVKDIDLNKLKEFIISNYKGGGEEFLAKLQSQKVFCLE